MKLRKGAAKAARVASSKADDLARLNAKQRHRQTMQKLKNERKAIKQQGKTARVSEVEKTKRAMARGATTASAVNDATEGRTSSADFANALINAGADNYESNNSVSKDAVSGEYVPPVNKAHNNSMFFTDEELGISK